MKIIFSKQAWVEYETWQSEDKKMIKRINALIKDITRSPFDGIGKPEPLKFALAGFWSRRINDEHRIIYRISDNSLEIAQLKYHY